jgi:hypothetical protein
MQGKKNLKCTSNYNYVSNYFNVSYFECQSKKDAKNIYFANKKLVLFYLSNLFDYLVALSFLFLRNFNFVNIPKNNLHSLMCFTLYSKIYSV